MYSPLPETPGRLEASVTPIIVYTHTLLWHFLLKPDNFFLNHNVILLVLRLHSYHCCTLVLE